MSRDSMVNWMIKFGLLLAPIAEALAEVIREQGVVLCDESPIVVGKKKKGEKKKYKQGYLWPILSEHIGVVFYYRPTRAYHEVISILDGFSGTLVTDAYGAYESLSNQAIIRWQLCWMHIRRNFVDAEVSNSELSQEALEYIRTLYKAEKHARTLSVQDRTLYRIQNSLPVLDDFHTWLKEISATPEVLTDDLMSKATSYVLKRWEAATLFVYDGAIPIDNGASERALRPAKLGAKNWLHCASEIGAEILAVFYSLIHSALIHGIHPYYYLLDLTKRLDDPSISAKDLVPHIWKERFLEEAIPEPFRDVIAPLPIPDG